MSEVDAIKVISETLEKLQIDEQARVLSWALAKFGGVKPTIPHIPLGAASPAPSQKTSAPPFSVAPKGKASKKAKSVISMDKTLNLAPQGKQSAVQFAAAKAPTNVREKCVVAVYYLRDVIELEKVSAQAVFTFFKSVQWPAPADLKNTLQQAGSVGWLDTANSDDIKLTSLGENLVEHDLPAKPKE
jgi:hypothetical protein